MNKLPIEIVVLILEFTLYGDMESIVKNIWGYRLVCRNWYNIHESHVLSKYVIRDFKIKCRNPTETLSKLVTKRKLGIVMFTRISGSTRYLDEQCYIYVTPMTSYQKIKEMLQSYISQRKLNALFLLRDKYSSITYLKDAPLYQQIDLHKYHFIGLDIMPW